MKKIDIPTIPGVYGFSMKKWKDADFVQVYRYSYFKDFTVGRIPPLRSKVVASKNMGLTIADHPDDCEWFKLSMWDKFKLAMAQMLGYHTPERTLRVRKPK